MREFVIVAKAGRSHSLFLTREGTVLACGDNKVGQLGQCSQKIRYSLHPIKVPGIEKISQIDCWNYSTAVTSNGDLYLWGKSMSPSRVSSIGQ